MNCGFLDAADGAFPKNQLEVCTQISLFLPSLLEYASSLYAACSRLATLSSTLSICSKYGSRPLSKSIHIKLFDFTLSENSWSPGTIQPMRVY